MSANELEKIDLKLSALSMVVELDFSMNRLTQISVDQVPELKSLNIANNQMRKIPNFVIGCSHLVELDAQFNQISGNFELSTSSLRKM